MRKAPAVDGEGLKVGQKLEIGYSIEPMATRMRAMVRESLVILLTPRNPIEEFNHERVVCVEVL